jgi:Tfp pilus assembly protein PilN
VRAVATLEARADGLLVPAGDAEAVLVPVVPGVRDPEEAAALLASALDAAGLGSVRSVDVLLHPPLVQVRTLADLPPVGPKDLEALVTNQQSRFFRPVEGPTVVSAEWTRSGDERVACAALASVELLERLEAVIERCARRVRRFVPVTGSSGPGPDLLTPGARATARRRLVLSLLAAAVLAAGGWATAGAVYVLDLRADGHALDAELSELDATLHRIDAISERLRAFAPVAEVLRVRSADAAWLRSRLAGLAEALPRDTHLHALSAERGGGLVIQGHGPDALAVVRALEERWSRGSVRLQGVPEPDAQDPEDGTSPHGEARVPERFTIVLGEAPR